MKKLNYCYAVLAQKLSNFAENLAVPLLYQKKGDISSITDLRYDKSKNSVCDFYYIDNKEKRPVLIYIHGGGFISGVKRLRKYYCYEYAKQGFFVMNTHYDYAPQKKFPHQIHQLFKAVEFLFNNAEKYKLDLSRIVLGGESAGGYFCCYLAAVVKDKSLYEKFGIEFQYKDTFDVKACVLLNGAYDYTRLAKNKFFNMGTFLYSFFGMTRKELLSKEKQDKCSYFSPLSFINKDFPPSVVVEASKDLLGEESRELVKLLNSLGIRNIHLIAKGIVGIHGFCLAVKTKEGNRILAETMNFIKQAIL